LQHAIEDLSSATGFLTRRSRDRQSKTVAALAQLQADIALPTADHIPDVGKMVETAAPVGERLTLSAEDVHAAFVKHFPKTRISQAWIGFAAEIAEAIAARAALIAGDAGWQPIETAPKDGENIWAFNGEQGVMHWIDVDVVALWVWEDDLLSDADPEPVQPTHWMPLPPPPSAIRAHWKDVG